MWPKPSELTKFYGDPSGQNGLPNTGWVKDNIILLGTPWRLITAWDGKKVLGVSVHHKCAPSLMRVFAKIWLAAKQNQKTIEDWGMHLFGGGFNYRLVRGGATLSTHAYGCAVDFDPARNGMGDSTPNFATVPAVLTAFADEGWTWGGSWARPDGMHWQAAK